MDRESPELIKRGMINTRESLTNKVAALEHQVVGTIQNATCAVNETVDSVKTAMKDTVHSVSDSVASMSQGVKETFDIRSHIRERPWSVIAGAAVTGLIAGYVIAPKREQGTASDFSSRRTERLQLDASGPRPSATGGIFDDVLAMMRQEFRKVCDSAVTTLAATVKQSLNAGIENVVSGEIFRQETNSDGTSQRSAAHNGHANANM